MIKMVLTLLLAAAFGYADDRPKLPQVAPGAVVVKGQHQCKVPDWLVHLPPAVESDYKECANTRNLPSNKLAETVLKQQVNKKADLEKVEPALEFYSRVYRVTYKIGSDRFSMLCNDSMEYCTAENPIVTRQRKGAK